MLCRAGREVMTETKFPQSSVPCLPCPPLFTGSRAYSTDELTRSPEKPYQNLDSLPAISSMGNLLF